jgi:ribosome biogenesis SPOUT family RNA methylase Rps3
MRKDYANKRAIVVGGILGLEARWRQGRTRA